MIVLLFDVSKLDISDEFRTHNQIYTTQEFSAAGSSCEEGGSGNQRE